MVCVTSALTTFFYSHDIISLTHSAVTQLSLLMRWYYFNDSRFKDGSESVRMYVLSLPEDESITRLFQPDRGRDVTYGVVSPSCSQGHCTLPPIPSVTTQRRRAQDATTSDVTRIVANY